MAEYIERGAVRKLTLAAALVYGREPNQYVSFLNELDSIPAAEVAEVVRCKDCRYYPTAKVNEKGFLICPASHMEIADDDFCSYGEQSEANHD